ncbi:hypothetical protein E2P81_ATG02429 [Venturia nashicola]|nr:hypothetical protein E2P81_ATG02429 [Venturia nashicola]
MRHTIITGATWLTLSALTFSAPLPHAGYDFSASTSSYLRRPQHDMKQERRETQLVVPNILPLSSQSIHPINPNEPAHMIPFFEALVPTKRQSIDHNGIPMPDHGFTSTTSLTPIANRHARRQEVAPPAPPKPTMEPEDEERKKEDQKKAEGDGVQASTPPAATVKEENKKTGEIHGGCDEVDLAKPISRRSGRREREVEGIRTGVRWACVGSH